MQEQIITSRQNVRIVELCKLADKKNREELKLFRFDGYKLLQEALDKGVRVVRVFARSDVETKDRHEELLSRAKAEAGAEILWVAPELFVRISEEKGPDGLMTVAEYLDNVFSSAIIKEDGNLEKLLEKCPRNAPILLLEDVQDPLNFGALLRSAGAFGTGAVICTEKSADCYHPRALRAAMGATFRMPVAVTDDLPAAVKRIRESGRRVFAAALNGQTQTLGGFEIRPGDCLIIGNEGHGLSQEVLDEATGCVRIPMQAGTESLNAAVAGGILLWSFRRS